MGTLLTRFYVYLPDDGGVQGPYAWDQLADLDGETLVMAEGRDEYWPLRRMQADGSLTVTRFEHARAWVVLLMLAPFAALFFAPDLWRVEWAVGWLICLACSWLMMIMSPREFPRFPGKE